MPASERVVVLMTPEEKAALDSKAAQAGRISTAEFVRRAVAAYDGETERDAAELRALLASLATTHTETLHEIDRVDRKLDATLADLARMKRSG
jgi:hypothetical protein